MAKGTQRQVRVLLAEDSPLVRQSIKTLLASEFDVIGEAADGSEAVRLARLQDPDVAILDLGMPVLDGIQATRQIRQASARTRVVLLSGRTEEYAIIGALHADADGYVAKQDVEELVRAVNEVCRGNRYLSSTVSGTLAGRRLPAFSTGRATGASRAS